MGTYYRHRLCVCLPSSLSLHHVCFIATPKWTGRNTSCHQHIRIKPIPTNSCTHTSGAAATNATQHVRRIHAERADDADTRTRCEEEGKTGRKFARPLSRSPAITGAASASFNAFLHCNALFWRGGWGIVVILLSWQMEARGERFVPSSVPQPAHSPHHISDPKAHACLQSRHPSTRHNRREQAPLLVVWKRKATGEQQVKRTVLLHCNSLLSSLLRVFFSLPLPAAEPCWEREGRGALSPRCLLCRRLPCCGCAHTLLLSRPSVPTATSVVGLYNRVERERGRAEGERRRDERGRGKARPRTAQQKRRGRKGKQGKNNTQATCTHAPYTHTRGATASARSPHRASTACCRPPIARTQRGRGCGGAKRRGEERRVIERVLSVEFLSRPRWGGACPCSERERRRRERRTGGGGRRWWRRAAQQREESRGTRFPLASASTTRTHTRQTAPPSVLRCNRPVLPSSPARSTPSG